MTIRNIFTIGFFLAKNVEQPKMTQKGSGIMRIKNLHLMIILISFIAIPSVALAWSSDTSVNTPIALAADDQEDPVVADDGMGGTVITWTDYRNSPDHRDVYAQRMDATGAIQWALNGVAVCTALETQYYLQIIGDGSGGAIMAWIDKRSGSDEIYAQRIDAGGTAQWTANGVLVTGTLNTSNYLGIISDGAGGIIMVWQDNRSGNLDVYAQRISTGGVTEWTAGGEPIAASAIYEGPPSITTDGSGGAIINWADSRNGNPDVWAQRVDASGAPHWAAGGVPVAADPNLSEYSTKIVSDGAGGAVVLMSHRTINPVTLMGLYVQKINASGVTQWPALVRLTDERYTRPVFISDGLGGAITNWDVYSSDDPFYNDRAIYAQGVDTDGNVLWASEGLFVGYKPYYSGNAITSIVNDNAGGFITTWVRYIDDNYQADIFAQHFNAEGIPQWTPDPAVICDNTATQSSPVVLADGSGGGVFVWQDERNGDHRDLYAHKYSPGGSVSVIQTPSNMSPLDGALIDTNVTFGSSAFVDDSGLTTHAASQWRINNINTMTPETAEQDISADDGYFTYTLPFSFPFFARNITSISVNTNGLIELLEDGETSFEIDGYGTHFDGDHLDNMDAIFAANDDLDLSNGYLRLYNAGTRVVIEWYGATYADADVDANYPDFTNDMRFQVVLYQDGRVVWNFSQLDFTLFDNDLYSGVYPNGGTEISMVAGSLADVTTPSAFEFNPASKVISASTYSWFVPQAVKYDSGEVGDLVSHLVPGAASLEDAVTYYWGVRYKGDNSEWSQWSTPTSFTVDILPPTVTGTVPESSAADVVTNTLIQATFSEEMDAGSIDGSSFTLTSTEGSVTGAVSYDAMTASFTPTGDLAYNTIYTATITTAATDSTGKPLANPYSWDFTTGAEADITPPTVSAVSPTIDALDVAIDIGSVSVIFSEAINASTINETSFTLTGPDGAVPGTLSYDSATKTARLDPTALLVYNTNYTATITTAIEDNARNALGADYNWTFTTVYEPPPPTPQDDVPPRVAEWTPTGTVPAAIGALTATFSEPIQNIDTDSFIVTTGGNSIAGTVQYDEAAMTAWFYPDTELAFGTHYTVTILSALIRDLADNYMELNHSWLFTTAVDPVQAGCDPDAGNYDGCDSFDYFTYGTGIELNTYGSSISGYVDESAARGSVSYGQSLTQDSTPTPGDFVSHAVARVDNTDFSLRSRSRRFEQSNDLAGTWSMGASKIDVSGVPPGTIIPMRIVVTGNFTGGGGTLLLQVNDFDDYRGLASMSVTGSGQSSSYEGLTFPGITYVQMIDPYGNKDDAANYVKTTDSGGGGYQLDFLYPAIPNNGIYVWFVAGVHSSLSSGETDFTATLQVNPPPGVTVTLASGQVFTNGSDDTDGDGVANDEDSAPNDASIASPAAATGTGPITIDVSAVAGATLSQTQARDDDDLSLVQSGKPANQQFPDGIVSFRVNGLQLGGVATVTLTFPTPFPASPAGLKYYKVNETGFYEFLGATFDRVANTVTLDLTDGGSGDSDVIANSVIIDPGGVAVPVSAGGAGGGGWCFIATAAYGTYWEPHVMTLRQFRDSYLLTNKLGTKFVETYYKYSPPMANYIAEHDSLRSVARIGLAPLVGFSWLALNYGMMAALAVLFGVLTMFIGSTCLVVHKREAN